jgi:WD40 repeat protein
MINDGDDPCLRDKLWDYDLGKLERTLKGHQEAVQCKSISNINSMSYSCDMLLYILTCG